MWSVAHASRLCQYNARHLTVPAIRLASTKVSTKAVTKKTATTKAATTKASPKTAAQKPATTKAATTEAATTKASPKAVAKKAAAIKVPLLPVAQKLEDTAVWQDTRERRTRKKVAENGAEPKKRKPKPTPKPAIPGDKTRVNIVSEKLCGDITKYIGSTLERHVGCDILDLNPGAGVWSRHLNDVLKPRSHILMEPDAELYKPFLEPLLSRPGTRLVPRSGILWKELNEAMTFLEHQKEVPVDLTKERERNDTLIVTANICASPSRRYRSFDSMAILILFQLITSIRTSSIFQKYGLIRMLVWVNDEDKRSFLPRIIQKRNKSALDAEFACEWFAEVAGKDPGAVEYEGDKLKKTGTRDHALDLQSSRNAMKRMAASNIDIIPDRLMMATKEAMETSEDSVEAGGANYMRPWVADLEALKKADGEGKIARHTEDYKRLVSRRALLAFEDREAKKHFDLIKQADDLAALHAEGSKKLAKSIEEFNESVEKLSRLSRDQFRLTRNNEIVFKQDPPVMLWDRRPWEPLKAEPDEFYPKNDCALLDIQPKSMHPLLRAAGEKGDRPSDILDLMHRALADESRTPISKGLQKLWPGALEGVMPHCPSLKDPAQGGHPVEGYAEITPRILNEKQWIEILEAFLKWPFRPSYAEMVGRLSEDVENAEQAPSVDTGVPGTSM
ncbi:hypothetical protein F5X68DRAFT_159263 [Plectosphaerella plurivora]|uniref:Mitochondrial transcription factor 1 n=1 Tax=Plectosphaerella plurivora TaxID=936078 RepID=A0A9P8V3A5_9PEZI|nr:hypothetical protein F5X68DRAFT_159263 [Plectosphaerella plurivora]